MNGAILRRIVDPGLLALLALSTVSGSSLWGAVPDPLTLALASFGAVVALVALVLAERFRLLPAEQVVVTVGLFVVCGGIVAGPVPSPESYASFSRGLIGGWADLLTTIVPTDLSTEFRVLPYVLGCVAATTAFLVVRRRRFRALAVVGPVAVFAVGLAFSAARSVAPLVQGSLLFALSIGYVAYAERANRSELDRSLGRTTVAARRNRLVGAVVVGAVCALLAPLAVAANPDLAAGERFEVRRLVTPRWEPLDEPSPLAQIKVNYGEQRRDEVVFTVTGDEIPERWTVATLGQYTGMVWTVGSSSHEGAARFRSFVDDVPERPGERVGTVGDDASAGHEVVVELPRPDVTGEEVPWLPVVAGTTAVRVLADDGRGFDVRADAVGRTIAVPDGASGVSYRLQYSASPRPEWAEIEDATLVRAPDSLELLSGELRDVASAMLEGLQPGWEQVQQLAQTLTDEGSYQTEGIRPGHSWGRLDAFAATEPLAGNEEQYAALAALIARNAGLTARVVVGYDIDDDKLGEQTIEVTRWEAAAWIEVLTVEHGWVAVDVTPPRDRLADANLPEANQQEVAATDPPAERAQQDSIEVGIGEVDDDDERADDDGTPSRTAAARIAIASGSVALPFVGFFGAIAAIGAVKARRRRRRQAAPTPTARIVGAWDETVDRVRDAGIDLPANLTNSERSALLQQVAPELRSLEPLANAVDQISFSDHEPDATYADLSWQFATDAVDELNRGASRVERLRRLASTTTLQERAR